MKLQSYNPNTPVLAQYTSATVVGLGVTGYSVVRYLLARGLSVQVVDSRLEPPMVKQLREKHPQVKLYLGDFSEIKDQALLVVSPGVSLFTPELRKARREGAHLIGDIELFVLENTKPIIAITGSNGKSTVTTLVGDMCEAGGITALVAGNIGLPVLDALTDQVDYEVAVLELSSFQLETTSHMHAQASAILNVSADHMDRYASMGDYLLAKARVLRGAERAILPRHDEQIAQLSTASQMLTFELDKPSNDDEFGIGRKSNLRWLFKGDRALIKLSDVPLIGMHNVKNVLAALALVDFLKIPLADLVRAITSFKGLPHRMQTVCVTAGVAWVNDSKATNIGATSTALQNLEQDIYWIAGGQGKGADFSELRAAIHNKIKLLVVLGEDAPVIQAALDGLLSIEKVDTMQEAVDLAGSRAKTGSVVLLSPACASFDMYDNFEQRGNDFIDCVTTWSDRGAA
ncbi:MAG: UDP-N-acetylmuramoylalanine--D-glutamate ligase [Parvicella sp.]|jgi:UDP-N-acetylmuramoylalanine--D-glutamate ligase